MKKNLILLGVLGLMLGIIVFSNILGEKDHYYLDYANKAVELFKDDEVDFKGVKKKDKKALENFLDSLDSSTGQIDITDHFIKNANYLTSEANSLGVSYANGRCLIRASSLKLDSKYYLEHDEIKQRVVCNKYYTYLYEDSILDYEDILNNPKYDYILSDYRKTSTGYEFEYVSVYDDSKIKLDLVIKDKVVSKIEVKY